MSLQNIPINKIRIVENHRTNIDNTHLDELMQSIKQHGLMQPIGVAMDGKKGYVLRFGQRRYLACKKLGYESILAIVSAEIGEEKMLLENLTENMQRKDPSFAELGRVINKLERMNLTQSQIAVRLGFPITKIKQIVLVYNVLPEKYRKRVMFMGRGGGRQAAKGMIPAQVAVKIINMKRDHGLNDKAIDNIFETVVDKGMGDLDLNNVASLMQGGISAEQALKNVTEYSTFNLVVVAKNADIQMMMAKHGLINKHHLFKKAVYGEIPPIPKPDFVDTGMRMKVVNGKPEIKFNGSLFKKMRDELVLFRKSKMLSEEQGAALNMTGGVRPQDWTPEQCEQIKNIYESIKNNKAKPRVDYGMADADRKD